MSLEARREEVYKLIRKARINRGLTYITLSANTGISEWTLNKLEGNLKPYHKGGFEMSTLNLISKALGLSMEDLAPLYRRARESDFE